jgi:hypothetical protein
MKKIPGAFFPPFDNLEETPQEERVAEKHEAVKEVKAVRNPCNTEGFYTPERRIPAAQKASEYITISVAEYHCLTKAATLLEMIFNCDSYHRDGLVTAARKTIQDIQRAAEAGAAE